MFLVENDYNEDLSSYLLDEMSDLISLNEEFFIIEKNMIISEHNSIINEADSSWKDKLEDIWKKIKEWFAKMYTKFTTFLKKVATQVLLKTLSNERINHALNKIKRGDMVANPSFRLDSILTDTFTRNKDIYVASSK